MLTQLEYPHIQQILCNYFLTPSIWLNLCFVSIEDIKLSAGPLIAGNGQLIGATNAWFRIDPAAGLQRSDGRAQLFNEFSKGSKEET